jgi:4,5-DOPA dioxygenase extradiol
MKRKKFLLSLAALPIIGVAMQLNQLRALTNALDEEEKHHSEENNRLPALFIGHGSPMNAIEENEFVQGFRKIGQQLPKPRAILCISAHWETKGTYLTAMKNPPTIHDFGGFPKALFDVQYPAPGSPELAIETQQLLSPTVDAGLDQNWGLDHGAWSVLKHLYPSADVPVIQMSLDYTKPAQYHYELAKELRALRNRGVLILGSGNMVHNLGMIAWDKLNTDAYGFDWALEANTKMKEYITAQDHQRLINYSANGRAFNLAIPSPEHYLPLLYILALQEKREQAIFFNDKPVAGSLTMTSVCINAMG